MDGKTPHIHVTVVPIVTGERRKAKETKKREEKSEQGVPGKKKIRDLYDRKDEAREKFLNMHEYNKQKENEISVTESRLAQLKQDYEPYKAQEDMNLFFDVFSKLSEHLRTVQLCKGIGLTIEAIKKLFNGEIVPITGKFHTPERDRDFSVQDAKLQLFKERDNPDKFRLSLNGQNILNWFKQKYQEVKQTIRPHIKSPAKPEVGKYKGLER